jgi:hypothetical protein
MTLISTLRSLAEQIRKHREVFQELSRDSLHAYDGFLERYPQAKALHARSERVT